MKRLAKHSFRVFSALCLGLLVLLAVMWVRSYWVLDRISARTDQGNDWKLRSEVGRISFWIATAYGPVEEPPPLWVSHDVPDDATPSTFLSDDLGFKVENNWSGRKFGFSRFFMIVPYWFPAVMMTILPTCRVVSFTRGRRLAPAADA